MFLKICKNVNLALAFLLELGVLASLAYWGFSTGDGILVKIGLALGTIVLAIVIWALFGAPLARWHLKGIWRVLLQILFFGGAAVALFMAGQHVWGVIFALISLLSWTLAWIWKQ